MASIGISVSVEPLTVEHGLWCNDCHLGSGVRAWIVAIVGNAMSLRSRKVCHDCGGSNVSD